MKQKNINNQINNVTNQNITPITIETLEAQRKEINDIYTACNFFSMIVCVLTAIITRNILIALLIFTFVKSLGPYLTNQKKYQYSINYKNYFVRTALAKTFSNIIYIPESGIDKSIIENTGMMIDGDTYYSNDLITGYYKNIAFTQADVQINVRNSDGNGTYTIFEGRWMIFDFNKQFKTNVQVCQIGFRNNRVESGYQKVEMESTNFNDIFEVYATNPHDAFYILTPTLMERIKNIARKSRGKIILCFIDNKIHMGINFINDSFEYGDISQKINEIEATQKVAREINQITLLVDELNLANNLFKK